MAYPLSELQEVRNLTTDDTDVIDDNTIESYILKYILHQRDARVYLAAADIMDYIGRDYNFDSMKLDNQSYTANSFGKKASYYRMLAASHEAFIV